MEQERKIGEVFEYNGEKIIVKKDSDFIYGCDKCVFNGNQNAVIIIACILKDKINKMCTLKKWRID